MGDGISEGADEYTRQDIVWNETEQEEFVAKASITLKLRRATGESGKLVLKEQSPKDFLLNFLMKFLLDILKSKVT